MKNISPRPLRFEGDVAFVPLSRGLEAIIDAADAHLVEHRNWHAVRGTAGLQYAAGNTPRSGARSRPLQRMHRIIIAAPSGVEVDHINGNGLDNRRCNLRPATSSQQNMNTRKRSDNSSGFKGVSWHTKAGKWRAVISANRKVLHLGYFESPDAAYEAYLAASSQHHGEFARACLARMRGQA